ncbi:MAG: hypothetical protein LC126_00175 [Bryobacterales bacterium]|nr:hypothetical protein [Bryobacterales bacterium]
MQLVWLQLCNLMQLFPRLDKRNSIMTLTLLSKGKLQFTALLTGAIATFYAARYLRVVQMANAQVTAAPFFLELMISQPGPDGTLVPFRRMALARRSDGTTVSIESAGFLHSGQTSRKVTFLDGRSLSIVDALKMKSTWPVQRPEVVAALRARLTSPQKDCMPPSGRGPRLLGMEKLHGEDAAVIQSPLDTPVDIIAVTGWLTSPGQD